MRPRGSCGCSARSLGSAETGHASRSSASRPAARSSPRSSRAPTPRRSPSRRSSSRGRRVGARRACHPRPRERPRDRRDARGVRQHVAPPLLDARRRLAEGSNPLSGTPGYAVAVDPETLPVSPDVALQTVDIPLVIGTNTDEYRLWFTPEQLAGISALKFTLARLATGVPRRAVRAYRAAFPGASPGEILGQIVTDRMLRGPAVRVAAARTAPTHVYERAWPSPVRDLRAAHAIDIGFVFDRVEASDSQVVVGPDAPRELAARMHADWVRVAQTGDPGWPQHGSDREVQLYDVPSRVTALRRAEALDSLPA